MSTQILHEAEQSRQHARYRIPVNLLFKGRSYKIDNWSISGFSIKQLPVSATHKQKNKGKLLFDFLDFETSMEIEFEIAWKDKDSAELGCRFVNFTSSQLSLLHYVINAYLSGEVVSNGDLINVLRRDNYSENKKKMAKPPTLLEKLGRRVRQILGYLALVAIIITLLLFITYTLYQRIYVVESLSATVDAPVVVIRAPQPSYYHSMTSDESSSVNRGKIIALAKLIGGGSNSIESPCDCDILAIHALDKQFVDRGEPIMTLLPKDARLYVNAKVSYQNVSKITIGQPVEIRFAQGKTESGFVTNVLASESLEKQHAAPLANTPVSPLGYADVLIETDTPLDTEILGAAVSVKIYTLPLTFSK